MLVRYAKKFMSIFGTTYNCEASFSTLSMIKTEQRSRLSNESLMTLMCVDSDLCPFHLYVPNQKIYIKKLFFFSAAVQSASSLQPAFLPSTFGHPCFIGKAFVNFDFGATFPDLIMCLSLLQYRQYVALLDGDLDHVRTISDLYSRVLDALENMIFAPVSTLSYMTPKGPVRVQIMPQAIKGPKSVPICTLPYENETIVQISILDVKYPEDSDYVLSQLIHLDLFAAITD